MLIQARKLWFSKKDKAAVADKEASEVSLGLGTSG